MGIASVFLDIDGVLSDPRLLGPEYLRLMGDILAPAIGGTVEDWGRANAVVFPELLSEMAMWKGDPVEIERREYTTNIQRMCEWLGIDAPNVHECVRIGREFNVYARRHAKSLFPRSADVIRQLAGQYNVHLATGNVSACANAVLDQLGVRELVGHPFGRDLAGHMKNTPEFHPAIFRISGEIPEMAVVADDSPAALEAAKAAGAFTVLVAPYGSAGGQHIDRVICGIGELPDAVGAF